MYRQFTVEKKPSEQVDQRLIILIFLLAGIGAAFLFSASSYFSSRMMADPYALLIKHIISCLLGTAVAIVVSRFPLPLIRKLIPYIFFITVIFNLITIFLGIQTLGAKRWLSFFGVSLQPSELIKPTIILYLAHIYSKNEDRMNDFTNAVLPSFIVITIFVALVLFQNDFSTAFIIFSLAFSISFVAGVSWKWLMTVLIFFSGAASLVLFTKPHRIQRILSWFDPLKDPAGASYQVLSSQAALRGGGIWGRGLGEGVQKLGGLPEAHSDFVFAVCGEEVGFIGVFLIIVLFAAFALFGYYLSERMTGTFERLTAFGITTSIFYQALINMAVVSGLVPATGIPLPFFSSGGTSILVTLAMCGLLINLTRYSQGAFNDG